MSTKSKREQVKPSIVWIDDGVQYTQEEFLKRLREVHKIEPTGLKGKRTMMSHIDADSWFSSTYKWEIGGKEFTQFIKLPRRGANLHQWQREG